MSDEEYSDSEFYYPEEQETAEKNGSSRWHFDKVEASGDIPGGLGIACIMGRAFCFRPMMHCQTRVVVRVIKIAVIQRCALIF